VENIPRVIEDFNQDELYLFCTFLLFLSIFSANVMKYVYKAMSISGTPTLLAWHAALINHSGIGIVSRAMVDRKV